MVSRVLKLVCFAVFLGVLPQNCIGFGEEPARRGSHCGLDAAKYVLTRFSIPIVQSDLSLLESKDSSSLSDLRSFFERFDLSVQCYEHTATDLSEWSQLNQLVQTRNAIVLVLAPSMEMDLGHYFALHDVKGKGIELIDPLTRAVVRHNPTTHPDPNSRLFSMVIYHPQANALTLPLSRTWVGLILAVLATGLVWYHFKNSVYRKKLFSPISLSIAALSITYASGCTTSVKFSLEGDTQDLGTVKLGEEVVADFNFQNFSSHSLHLYAIELGCSCQKTDFKPTTVGANESYSYRIRARDNVVGSRSQLGRILIQDHQNVTHALSYQLNYEVEVEKGFFPNPYFLGIVDTGALSAGLPFELSIHDSQGERLAAKVIKLNVVSYLGIELPQCRPASENTGTAGPVTLVFSGQNGQGSFEALFDAVVEFDHGVSEMPIHISGRAIERQLDGGGSL